jgi:hypothetical protein
MELIMAILVWMGLLSPGQQITATQYYQLVEANSTAIQQVASDTLTTQQALSGSTQSPQVVIIDPMNL